MRQLRWWKRLWRRSLTRSHKRTFMGLEEVVGTVQQVHCSRRRLLRRRLEFHVCTINKSAYRKKVKKIYRMHLVCDKYSVDFWFNPHRNNDAIKARITFSTPETRKFIKYWFNNSKLMQQVLILRLLNKRNMALVCVYVENSWFLARYQFFASRLVREVRGQNHIT